MGRIFRVGMEPLSALAGSGFDFLNLWMRGRPGVLPLLYRQ